MTYLKKKHNPHIAMLLTAFKPSPMGGAERQAFNLAKQLKSRGYDVSLFALGQRGQRAREVVEGINVFRIKIFFTPYFYSRNRNPRRTSKTRIDYAESDINNSRVNDKTSLVSFINYCIIFLYIYFSSKWKRAGINLLYVPSIEWTAFVGSILGKALAIPVLVKDSTMNGITNILRYPFGDRMQQIVRANCSFVAMSMAIRNNLINAGISAEKIFSIPNGVALPDSQRNHIDINKFVFVGNLYQQPAKGVDILLKAWKIILSEIPTLHLLVVGDGDIPAYEEYVANLGMGSSVHFLGKQKDVHSYLEESLAFILPSRREGMSNALLEAMALGVAPIATDISGNQDLIVHNFNGLLIPVEDVTALVEAVKYMRQNVHDAKRMGENARKTIERRYTINIVSRQYDQVIRQLLRRN